jgi:hypothetical protein
VIGFLDYVLKRGAIFLMVTSVKAKEILEKLGDDLFGYEAVVADVSAASLARAARRLRL